MKRFRAQWPRFNRCVKRSILSSRRYVNLTVTRKDCLRKTGSFAYDSRSMRGLQRIPITAALHQPRRASRLKSLGAQSLNDRNLTGPSEGRLGMKARPGRWLTSLCFYYFVSRLSPLPDADSSQADEQEKVLELFTLQRRKKLLQTGYRLTFSYSKLGLASFASENED